MSIKENKDPKIISIETTSNYGIIKDNSINFDVQNIFGERFLEYRLQKIKCQKDNNLGIVNLEIFYREKDTNLQIKSIDLKKPDSLADDIEQYEFESMEMVTGLIIFKNKENEKFNGFEIKTNRKRVKQFGICDDNSLKIELDEFSKGENYLLGFFGAFDKNDGVQSMGFYYINKLSYNLIFYYGYFELKIKLKRKEYKKEIEKKKDKMSLDEKAIFMTASLPSNQFYQIVKFAFC